jgi:predicted  nucleic acid-binding Zn-ribbon protein
MKREIETSDHEKYRSMRDEIYQRKIARSDLFDQIRSLEKQIKKVQEEFLANQELVDKKEEEFQDFINSLGEKYELGTGIFNISENAPHTIELVS